MTKNNNNEGRVAQLAATLPTIDAFETFFDSLGELEEEAADYCSYNSSFFCNGEWVKCDYEDTAKACIIQCVEDYQVLRFFAVDVFLDGSDYYHLATSDPDECLDDEMEYHQLEVKSAEEYRQVWFDKQGNIVERLLTDDYNKNERDWNSQLVSAQSFQPWIYEPRHKNYLLAEVNEHSYYCDGELSWLLSDVSEYLRKYTQIYDIVNNTPSARHIAKKYFRTIRIANRHHFAFPTDSTHLNLYFDYIKTIDDEGTDILNPKYICREDWEDEHQRIIDRRDAHKYQMHIEEARAFEEKFKEIHKDCMGIVFDTEDYHFQSLDSAEAYVVEGHIMHHCIGGLCKFYKHENEVSFHISDHEGNRVATCTVNLKEKRVRELQTICNNAAWRESDEYKTLWNIMSARAHTFRRKRKATSSTTKADRKAA